MPRALVAVGIAAALLLVALPGPTSQAIVEIGEESDAHHDHDHDDHHGHDHTHAETLDVRTGAVEPTAAQLRAVEELGANASWTQFGTAQSLVRHGDYLATDIEAADPGAAALAWVDANRNLYRLSSVSTLEVDRELALTDDAYVVVLRQTIAGLPISPDGTAAVGVVGSAEEGWSVAYASSTIVTDDQAVGTLQLRDEVSAEEALVEAVADVEGDLSTADVEAEETRAGWQVFAAEGLEFDALARPVLFPTARGELRMAYETVATLDAEEGYRHIIDAETGEVLYRESTVDHAATGNIAAQAGPPGPPPGQPGPPGSPPGGPPSDPPGPPFDPPGPPGRGQPTWEVYPDSPPLTTLGAYPWNYPSADRRDLWCWVFVPGCKLIVSNADPHGVAWDVDPLTGEPTFTTIGNYATTAEWWLGPAGGPRHRPTAPDRQYRYPWTNAWFETQCHPDNLVEGGNDIDASIVNLFAMHNRFHNWSYHLGFDEPSWNAQEYNFGRGGAEGDPVIGRAQHGAISPGSRNNATMNTQPDGTSSITQMFLWQPQRNAFYAPCVVGDFDMSVIGHEYTHMIENRLIGKGFRRGGFHAGAMGESVSDLFGVEYLNQYGFAPVAGEDPWAVGAYVTGNPVRGIRNYNMSFPSSGAFQQPGEYVHVNPLNFGSMGYDIVGPQVHADGEMWSATNFDIRNLLLERYPQRGPNVIRQCADGRRPAEECPGSYRWVQIYFDAMKLMPISPTMLDARDAFLAADVMRFDGANQDLLWRGFAQRGFGENASVGGTQDPNPVPGYESPYEDEATLTFEAVAKDEDGATIDDFEVYVGHYQARNTPIESVTAMVADPRGYDFVARADGYGHVRFHVDDLEPGEERTITIHFPTNVASQAQGATASGDGERLSALIDDTEATNWESTGAAVEGRQVTIALDGEQTFTQAKASALLLPGQNRFTALRQFAVFACTEGGAGNPDCDGDTDTGWTQVLESSDDAFPGHPPRPTAPDLILRTFDMDETTATHVKFEVVGNQCTANPDFQGEQHNDPTAPSTDCRTQSTGAEQVRAAALQLLTSEPEVEGASLYE